MRALRGIDLRVEQGRIFGFLGPNGAGKTTTIRLLLDLIRPTSGTARVLGFDAQRESMEVRARCGYLPGELHLYESMRGHELLDLFDSFRPAQRDLTYRNNLCERLGLDVSRHVRALSKGNKQKLGIVQALMHRPELLVLDEPTSGLDPLVQEEVAKLLEEAVSGGTHGVLLIARAAGGGAAERVGGDHPRGRDRRGRGGRADEVALGARDRGDVRGGSAGRICSRCRACTELRRDGHTVHLQARDGVDGVIKAIASRQVFDLRTEQPSLEDVFLSYYGGHEGATGTDGRSAAPAERTRP